MSGSVLTLPPPAGAGGGGEGGEGITQLVGGVNAGPGSGVQTATLSVAGRTRAITIQIDNGDNEIAEGFIAEIPFPYAATLTGISFLADQAGAITIEVLKRPYARYETPVPGDSIFPTEHPGIAPGDVKNIYTTLPDWVTAIAAGDIYHVQVVFIQDITKCAITFTVVAAQ